MRHFSLMILFFCAISSLSAQNPHVIESPKELGKRVFSALQNYDLSLYQQLIALDTDCEYITENLSEADSIEMLPILLQKSERANEDSELIFSNTIDEIYMHEIDLLQTSIIQIRYTIKSNEAVETTDIHLVLRYMNKTFKIIVEDCVKSSSWLILGGVIAEFEEN